MFNVSWGELAIVTGIGLAIIGKKDLPNVAYMVGTQLGRIVGLLQGARVRADQYAAQSELRQLQNELRLGLRELDAVRSELAVSISAGGFMGRNLGALTSNSDNKMTSMSSSSSSSSPHRQPQQLLLPPPSSSTIVHPLSSSSSSMGSFDILNPNINASLTNKDVVVSQNTTNTPTLPSSSSTVYQTTAAVAEQEWVQQGIGFISAGEQGLGVSGVSSSTSFQREKAGSVILSNLIQQSLIFDQYDRVVAEQDAALQSKVATILQKHQEQKATK